MLPVIVYQLGRLDHGGAEMRSLQLFRAVRSRHPALEIVVYVTSGEPGALDEQFAATGVRIVHGRPGLKGLPHFWQCCRRHGATLVHVNAGTTSGFFALAAFLARIDRRICHLRAAGDGRIGASGRFRARVGAALIRLFATDIVGVCAAARLYVRVPESRWLTLYNGIELADPPPAFAAPTGPRGEGVRNLIFLARICPQKNYLRPLAILEALARRHGPPTPRLHFVGTGTTEHQARLAARIAVSPVGEAVVVHGRSDEPLRHLRRADLLLLTSTYEGLPGTVLEALSVGTPVVASDLPGLREIAAAVEGVTLVPLSASDEQWSDAVAAALGEDRTEAIIASFRRGPFRFEPYVAGIASLWGLPAPQLPPLAAAETRPVGDDDAHPVASMSR